MFKKRNLIVTLILLFVTIGIYGLYWFYSTADELIKYNNRGGNPLAWLIMALIPILNLVAIWFHASALETASRKAMGDRSSTSAVLLFILWIIFPPAGLLVSQATLNNLADATTP